MSPARSSISIAPTFPPTDPVASQRSFGEALRDVFGNDFKTWSFAVNVSYPIGTSQADAALAQAKLQKQQELTSWPTSSCR